MHPAQAYQQPVPMHRRMPIEAAGKHRCKFPRRPNIRVRIQNVGNLVRVFLMNALQGQLRKPTHRYRIKHSLILARPRPGRQNDQEPRKNPAHHTPPEALSHGPPCPSCNNPSACRPPRKGCRSQGKSQRGRCTSNHSGIRLGDASPGSVKRGGRPIPKAYRTR